MEKRTTGLLAAASLMAVVSGTAVQAQTTASTPVVDDASVSEIVVTAQRRASLSKDVPIAVTALSAASLTQAGVNTSQDLVNSVPGLRMNQSGTISNPTIRGVTSSVAFLAEPNVATYVDNVYQATNFIGFANLPDVESVQVLKGPQGTLFGRNATGGAILVKTRDPEFDTTGTVAMSFGRYNQLRVEGFVTAPLVEDVLAFSVAGLAERRDPYMRNIAFPDRRRDYQNNLVRAKLRFQPSEDLNFILSGLYAHNTNGDGSTFGNYRGNTPVRGLVPDALLASNRNEFASDQELYFTADVKSANLSGVIQAGPGEITTTTAYTATSTFNPFDADNSSLPLIPVTTGAKTKTFTQELLYTFKGIPRFNGTIGAFYFYNTAGYDPLYYGTITSIRTKDRNESVGVFGELSYELTDSLQITGGLRYNWEKRQANVGFAGPFVPVPESSIALLGEKSWNSLTPRVSVLYRLSRATNLFATYSQGFKSGVFNTYSAQAEPVNPEKLKAYEAGIKSATRNYDFSLSGFYYNYSDIQVSSFNGITQLLQNAASARMYGADLTLTWKPTRELNLAFGANYLNAKYRSFPNASVYVPNPATPLPVGVNACDFNRYTPANTGNVGISCDVRGNRLPLSAPFSTSLAATYKTETELGLFTLSANGYYSSKFYFEPLNRLSQKGYATFGARVSWSPEAASGFELSVYGQNLTNTKIFETLLVQVADTFRYQIPTTYGIQARYSF